jgi:hypothetical protein
MEKQPEMAVNFAGQNLSRTPQGFLKRHKNYNKGLTALLSLQRKSCCRYLFI